MSNDAKRTSTVGEIVNLMSVDAQRMQDVFGYLWMVWSCPLQIIIAVYLLWGKLGASVLAGLGVMLLLIPLNGVMATYQRKLQVADLYITQYSYCHLKKIGAQKTASNLVVSGALGAYTDVIIQNKYRHRFVSLHWSFCAPQSSRT